VQIVGVPIQRPASVAERSVAMIKSARAVVMCRKETWREKSVAVFFKVTVEKCSKVTCILFNVTVDLRNVGSGLNFGF